jgi:hypothetical protein
LKPSNILISVGEDDLIAGPEIAILAQPIGGQQEALGARTEVCLPAIGVRSFFPFALENAMLPPEGTPVHVEPSASGYKLELKVRTFDVEIVAHARHEFCGRSWLLALHYMLFETRRA